MANQEEYDIEDVAALDQEIVEAEHEDDDEPDDVGDKSWAYPKKGRKPDQVVDISGKEHGENAKVHLYHNMGPGKKTVAHTIGSTQTTDVYSYNKPPSAATVKRHWSADGVNEETQAASTLHPKGAPGEPMSKLGAMKGVMNVMAGMGKSDMIDFFNQVQAQFGPGKMPGAVDNSAKNSSTLDMKASHATGTSAPKTKDAMPKLNVKEDIEEMFAGQDLSEEFKESVETLFEAAISARLIAETARLEEEYEERIQEEVQTFSEELTSKLDTYLDYVVEQFMKENEVAIESTLRNELAEEFIDGLKNLFAEHYISVPEEKIDVLEAMAEKVAVLEEKLDEAITVISEQDSVLADSAKNEIFEELSSDLALTQQEKFAALAEGIEFDGDLDVYARKLAIVKENYFRNDSNVATSNFEEETFEGDLTEGVKNVDPVVNRYVQAISKTIKK